MAPPGRFGPPSALASAPAHDAELRTAARHLARRRFLTVAGAAAALAFTTGLPARAAPSPPPGSTPPGTPPAPISGPSRP